MNTTRRALFAFQTKWQWWHHTRWFQWAHKPLCQRFEHGVLHIGSWRVCRGCTMLYSGLIAATLLLLGTEPPENGVVWISLAVIAFALPLTFPPWYAKCPRKLRDLVRFSSGTLPPLLAALLYHGRTLEFLFLAAVLTVAILCFRRLRAEVKKYACEGCPELAQPGICSGYHQQAQSLRVYSLALEEKLNTSPPASISRQTIPYHGNQTDAQDSKPRQEATPQGDHKTLYSRNPNDQEQSVEKLIRAARNTSRNRSPEGTQRMAKKNHAATKIHAIDYLEAPNKTPASAFCVAFGDEAFLKHEVLSTLKHEVLGDGDGEFSLSVFTGKETDWPRVVDALSTASLFGPAQRLVLVEDADTFVTKYREKLEDYAEKPSASGVLLLDVKTWPGNTRLAKRVAKSGTTIECRRPTSGKGNRLDERRVASWLRSRAKKFHRVEIAAAAAETLVQMVEPEFGLLDQELAKLAPIVGEKGKISVELVAETVGGWRTRKTWDMIDAAVEGKAADALLQLDRLILAGEEPIALLGQIAATLRRFAIATRLIKDAERNGRRPNLREALIQAGIPHFFVEKSQNQLRQLGRQRGGQIFQWLLDADLAMKGTSSSKPRQRLVLEQLIVHMAQATAPRKPANAR